MRIPSPPIRYVLQLPASTEPVRLDPADVVPYVRGYAAALRQSEKLDGLDLSAAEDTIRVQSLQIGHASGWFRFLYQERESE